MFVGIENTPRDYAWGSATAISGLLGTTPSGGPEAELWLGSHAGSPARIIDPAQVGGARDLVEWIAAAPSDALGSHPRLPFLLKVLAAASPLSLQAHPTAEQAQDGFARENALGVRLDAPERNYKDPYPKPEIICAVSERFEALCGFRPLQQTVQLLHALGLSDLAARIEAEPLADVFEWLVTRGDGVAALVDRVSALADSGAAGVPAVTKTKEFVAETTAAGAETAESARNSFILEAAVEAALGTVRMLAAEYPGDPGIVVSLLLNRVTLRRGEALYLPAGNIHAYLSGLGIELMTASDNVLRGGLTTKHVDIDELLNVLDFTPTEVPYLRPLVSDGAALYRPAGPGFKLLHVTGATRQAIAGPTIVLCTAGALTVTGKSSSISLARGDAVYVTPDEAELAFAGDGEAFLATTA
ncbi:mannose-6-phosphate isomerase, class I [Homoserinimonas sp. A447]